MGIKNERAVRTIIKTLFISMFLMLLTVAMPYGCARQPRYQEAPVSGDNVVIDLAGLPADRPVFYTYTFNGNPVSFFIVKTQSGADSFLDACKECYQQKKGYAWNKDSVVCRACDQRYTLQTLANGFGNCYPIILPGKVEGANYIIPVKDIKKIAHMF